MAIAELQLTGATAPRLILNSMVGSRAHGTENDDSDTDLRGVCVQPTSVIVGLNIYKESFKHPDLDELAWELEHFLRIAMNCDPNALECLAVEPSFTTEQGRELRSLFRHFLSRTKLKDKYCGFARRQKHELKSAKTKVDRDKSGSHYLRIIYNGIELMKTGQMTVRIMDTEFGATVLSAKRGELSAEEVVDIGEKLELELIAATATSSLPIELDERSHAAINDFLLQVRKSNW